MASNADISAILHPSNRNVLGSNKSYRQYFYDKAREESRLGGPVTPLPAGQSRAETKEQFMGRKLAREEDVVTKELPSTPSSGIMRPSTYVPSELGLDEISKRLLAGMR
jgi:hypothetical protein